MAINKKPEMTARQILIFGKVQGVFFRHSAKIEADKLKLKGYVKNLSGGTVECIVEGEADKIRRFSLWCQTGPPLARVQKVTISNLASKGYNNFSIQ